MFGSSHIYKFRIWLDLPRLDLHLVYYGSIVLYATVYLLARSKCKDRVDLFRMAK